VKHFVEIKLLSDPEFHPTVLMNTLYGKLHTALVRLESGRIGVSFPDFDDEKPTLGNLIRLHGDEDDLNELMKLNWLVSLNDYTLVSSVAAPPASIGHRIVCRVQAHSNAERMRRRLAKHAGVTMEEARLKISDSAVKHLALPYLRVRSASSGEHFRLFIKHGPIQPLPVTGEFSYYGLSPIVTVPWF
jgi:CRISPR-associated endonuclease Csy4